MPAKRPVGARSETIRCEKCGEYYAVTYKRCPFCEDDEPTRIFRRPRVEVEEEEPRRSPRRSEPQKDSYDEPPRRARPVLQEEPDEYEELLSRRPHREEEVPPPRRVRREAETEEYAPRHSSYEDEDEYEEPRRRRRYDDEDDDDEFDDDYEPRSRRSEGGKRLVTNARGGGYRHRGPSPGQIIRAVLSIALIVAAIWIVFTIVKSFTGGTGTDPNTPSTSPITSADPSSSPGTAPSEEPSTPPVSSESVPPAPTTAPSDQTATGFTLYNEWGNAVQDITLEAERPTTRLKVVFTPEGSTGYITWQSSKPNIVTVDQSGNVTAVAQGVATITATMAGGYARECIVRSNVGGTPAVMPSTSPSASPAPSTAPSSPPSSGGKLSLNVGLGLDGVTYDFSLGIGESWNLKVKNAAGAATWSVKDPSVATVDANGKVVGVSKGSTTVTASVDGQTLACIVRVH